MTRRRFLETGLAGLLLAVRPLVAGAMPAGLYGPLHCVTEIGSASAARFADAVPATPIGVDPTAVLRALVCASANNERTATRFSVRTPDRSVQTGA